jgi:hypothetical protein
VAKSAAANRGRTHTPETRAKMSAAAKARWARARRKARRGSPNEGPAD